MKITLPILAVTVLALLPLRAGAQDFDMNGAQEACQDDVFTLCGEAVPDHARIEACLKKQWTKVSAKCRTFMSNIGKPTQKRGDCKPAGSDRVASSSC